MKRLVDKYLLDWKHEDDFKPLLLRGARQVGKTYSVRALGKTFDNFVEVNLEKSQKAREFFSGDLDTKKIIQNISFLTDQVIKPGNTLLFLDEIQAEPRAILALRYFYEEMPNLHVIAAGSLLDFAIEEVGIPVGRVEFLYMYPLSFLEFLVAKNEKILIEAIFQAVPDKLKMNEVAHDRILNLLSEYLAIGGMPEVVNKWVQSGDLKKCFKVQQTIVSSYKQDFNKYAKKTQIKYLDALFSSIPLQLGKKFKYSAVEGEFRKRELSPGLDLLCTAGIVNKVYHSASQGIPLGAQIDPNDFKVLFLDIALAQVVLGFDLTDWFLSPDEQFVNKGELIESFIGQELISYSNYSQKKQLYYWSRAERTAQAEIDYVVSVKQKIIPVEVKSGKGTTLKSMHIFLEKHKNSLFGVKFSTQNYSFYENIYSYPLYASFILSNVDLEFFKKFCIE